MSLKPDAVLQLTSEQMEMLVPLKAKQNETNGMILGSVGIERDGDTIALSFIPYDIAVKINELAEKELEQNDVKN